MVFGYLKSAFAYLLLVVAEIDSGFLSAGDGSHFFIGRTTRLGITPALR